MPGRVHWQDIQQNTFTRWVNEYIGKRGMHVDNLQTDLADGLCLINLMEIISGKRIGRYNRHPKVKMQKVENIGIALNFIKSEGITLVNIGSEDIASGNLRLILGLIWTLILRYEINCGNANGNGQDDLLRWVRQQIPEYDIKNFQKDWNDGRALCALVNKLQPGLCPGHRSKETKGKANKLRNAQEGIHLGETRMGIQPLITPEEMTHPKVDKQALMTYIAQYRRFQPSDAKQQNDAQRCNAYGPGLQEGTSNTPAHFKVDVPSDVKRPVRVRVEGPTNDAKVHVVKNSDGNYDVDYNPTVPGDYRIHVTVGGDPVPGSVFHVSVLSEVSLGGEGKIRVYFSTTSSSLKTRTDTRRLQDLLEGKRVHLRADFEPWIAIDVAMDVADRKLLFAKAGTKDLPIVFIDDKYVGDYDTLADLNETGQLDDLLNIRMASLVSVEQHKTRMNAQFGADGARTTTTTRSTTATTGARGKKRGGKKRGGGKSSTPQQSSNGSSAPAVDQEGSGVRLVSKGDAEWEKDADVQTCRGCDCTFTLTKRKHHCRLCGRIFCQSCSAQKVEGQRACDGCAGGGGGASGGAERGDTQATPTPRPTSRPTPRPAPRPTPPAAKSGGRGGGGRVKFCSECGTKATGKSKFCANCGNKL